MSEVSNGCSLPAAGRRRSSGAIAHGPPGRPGDHPVRARPGDPLAGPRRPRPADRLPRRELRRDRLRLRRRGALAGSRAVDPPDRPPVPVAARRARHAAAVAVDRRRRCRSPPSASASSMIALQASIGALNDLVDAPAGRGPQAAASRSRPGSVAPTGPVVVVVSGASRAGVVDAVGGAHRRPRGGRPGDRLRLRPRRSRARPGRGCRSPSGSRCCPSSAGSAPPGPCQPRSRPACPLAVLAGTALAIANARADARARRRRRVSIPWRVRLGPGRAWAVHASLLGRGARGSDRDAVAAGAAPPGSLIAASGGGLVIVAGIGLRRGRDGGPTSSGLGTRGDRDRVCSPPPGSPGHGARGSWAVG